MEYFNIIIIKMRELVNLFNRILFVTINIMQCELLIPNLFKYNWIFRYKLQTHTFSLTIVFNHFTTLYLLQVATSFFKLHSIWHFWTKRSVVLSKANEWVRREQIINKINIQHDIWVTFGHPILQNHSITPKYSHFIIYKLIILTLHCWFQLISINRFIFHCRWSISDDHLSRFEFLNSPC